MGRKHEYSLFTGLAHHHKKSTECWIGASADTPLIGFNAWNFEKLDKVQNIGGSSNLEIEQLSDANLLEWLEKTPPKDNRHGHGTGSLQSRIQLLICHEKPCTTRKEEKRRYCMTRKSYDCVEEAMELPVRTLPCMANQWGTQSSDFEYSDDGEIKCLDLTMKTTRVDNLTQSGIAISYDFASRTTRAFARGLNAVKLDYIPQTNGATPKSEVEKHQPAHSLLSRFTKSLPWSISLWQHPLLLPVIILQYELASIRQLSRLSLAVRSNSIAENLSVESYDEMAKILGGETAHADLGDIDEGAEMIKKKGNASGKETSQDARTKFISSTNRLMRDAIDARRALQTTQASAAFLLEVLGDLEESKVVFADLKTQRRLNQKLRSLIKNLDRSARGFEAAIEAIISNMEVQLDLLSIVASQLDNVNSSKMAAQAGLDGVAMLTLAVVTAIFLPGTFVATVFSMSMFDWQAESGDSVVSKRLWVFWVIAIPLTLLVLILWGSWWLFERTYYAAKFQSAEKHNERLRRSKLVGNWLGKHVKKQRLKKPEIKDENSQWAALESGDGNASI